MLKFIQHIEYITKHIHKNFKIIAVFINVFFVTSNNIQISIINQFNLYPFITIQDKEIMVS